MARSQKKVSKLAIQRLYINKLLNVCLNLFEWTGMPDTVNLAAMERALLSIVYALFFRDEDTGAYFGMEGTAYGLDVYGWPTRFKPVPKGDMKINFHERTIKDTVIIYNNKLRSGIMDIIFDYAIQLAEVESAIRLNIKASKHPIFASVSEPQRSTVEALLNQYDDNYYVLVGAKEFDLNGALIPLNFNVSTQEILNLQKVKETIYNEFYRVFGIGGNIEKRERLLTSEVGVATEQVYNAREIMLQTRRTACEQINKMYGLNVSVDFAHQKELDKPDDEQKQEEPEAPLKEEKEEE